MARLAYLVPGVGLDEAEIERREGIANDLVTDDVRVIAADSGPLSIESTVEEQWSVVGLLELLPTIEAEFDGFVIGCFGDPGLHALRELTDKPVVGPASASFHTAVQLADTFACITILDSTEPLTRRLVHEYDLDDKLVDVPVVEAPVLDIDHSSDELVDEMVAAGRRAVEGSRAQALVPGCMSLSFMQVHEEIADRVGVPFVDPVTVGLETASTWARHGISHSPEAYSEPDWEKLDGLVGTPTASTDD